jgi:Spy/CpxP family protein refolding chaperone
MTTSKVMAGAAASVVLAGALAVAAQPPGGDRRRPSGRAPMDGAAAYLGLSDEQKAQLSEHREKARPQIQAMREKVRANHEKMRAALDAQPPDPATVGAIAIEGHRLQLQMKAQREAAEKEMRAMLTPEQQTRFDALQALRRSGPGRRGPMGPMPFGPGEDMGAPGVTGGADDEPPPPPQE